MTGTFPESTSAAARVDEAKPRPLKEKWGECTDGKHAWMPHIPNRWPKKIPLPKAGKSSYQQVVSLRSNCFRIMASWPDNACWHVHERHVASTKHDPSHLTNQGCCCDRDPIVTGSVRLWPSTTQPEDDRRWFHGHVTRGKLF